MALRCIFLVSLIVGTAWAQSVLPDVPELENVTLPPILEGKLDQKDVDRIQNQSISEFKQKCEKNGGPDAFDKAQNASKDLGKCVTDLINPKQLQQEIEEAKPNGNVDEVFQKYCAKKPVFEGCVKTFTETTKVCLSADEQKHLKTVYNVSEQLAEFICFKEGDRIALFIAEGGQECFQDKQEGLMSCFNQTGVDQSHMPKTLDPSAFSNFTLSFDEKQCKQLFDLQICVVNVLETCPKPTSANIVESLFKFIRKATPCKNFKEPTPSGASAMFVATASLVMAAFAFFI